MPARNAEPWLEQAVASILSQSFADFELVILDDASDDGTRAILRRLAAADTRIRLFETDERLGPVGSSNYVVEQARAPIVARMDADDVAAPDRLRKQLEALTAAPDAVLVGGLAETIDRNGCRVRPADYTFMMRGSLIAPFPHSSILFRRDSFDRIGGYRAGAAKWEDIDLFLRMARAGKVLVVPEPLMSVRQTGGSTRFAEGVRDLHEAIDLMHASLAAYRRGEDYTPLLRRRGVRGRVSLEVFHSGGSSSLWTGRRPGVLWPMLRTGRLHPTLRSAALLAWAAAADISPKVLRFAMRKSLEIRNRRARRRLGAISVVEWRPR